MIWAGLIKVGFPQWLFGPLDSEAQRVPGELAATGNGGYAIW